MIRNIPDHSGYQVTEDGRIYSLKRKKFLAFRLDKHGYLCVSLTKGDGRSISRFVHRLVALAYIDNTENKPQVNHKNSNKLDNRACNLEWVTQAENNLHSYRVGLKIHWRIRKKIATLSQM